MIESQSIAQYIPDELRRLASYFPQDAPLYVVGGLVRQALLGAVAANPDIDLASALPPERLQACLADTPFGIKPASPRLGTVIVVGERRYEYTAFRIDSYPTDSGAHAPLQVRFTDDLTLDARRRDFRCNAIYYDIRRDEIVDPTGGVADIEARVLDCADDPDRVLSEDGLRLMRLARFQSRLGFRIAPRTYDAACRLCDRLDDISPERIAAELEYLLDGDFVADALRTMRDTGMLARVLPELSAGDGLAQNPQYHRYDVLEHSIRACAYAPRSARLAALLHDVGKPPCMARDGNCYRHAEDGARLTCEILTRYRYPKREIQRVTRLVAAHMLAIKRDIRESKLRVFCAQNRDILQDLAALMRADARATGYATDESDFAARMLKTYADMVADGVPLDPRQLAIDGDALATIGARGKQIGETLDALWHMCVTQNLPNEREPLTQAARRAIERLQKENE